LDRKLATLALQNIRAFGTYKQSDSGHTDIFRNGPEGWYSSCRFQATVSILASSPRSADVDGGIESVPVGSFEHQFGADQSNHVFLSRASESVDVQPFFGWRGSIARWNCEKKQDMLQSFLIRNTILMPTYIGKKVLPGRVT
jgi:hypothetical protein